MSHSAFKKTIARGLLCLMIVGAFGCGSEGGEGGSSASASQQEGRLNAFVSRLPELIDDRARRQAGGDPFGDALVAAGASLHASERLKALYTQDERRPVFVRGGALTSVGKEVWDALRVVDTEGLSLADYHAPELEKRLAEMGGGAPPETPPELSQAQRDALLEALAKLSSGSDEQSADAALLGVLDGVAGGTPLEAWMQREAEAVRTKGSQSMIVEVLLADGALRYAHDMMHGHQKVVDVASLKGDASLRRPVDVLESDAPQGAELAAKTVEAQAQWFQSLREAGRRGAGAAEKARAALKALRPLPQDFKGPMAGQYARLLLARARYQKIVDEGGWPMKFPRFREPKRDDITRFTPGFKRYPDEIVLLTKKRLAGEGLYDGPIDNKWEEAFTAAVKRYRRNNGMRDRAWIDYEMVQSMKVSAEVRLAQIDLNLERLRRASPGGGDDYYVYVNIPSFRGQLWDGGEKTHDFKVIVGSRKRYRSKKSGALRFPDATPTMIDKMESLVFNPFWTAPARIRAQLKRQAKGNPDFWKENGYEIISAGGGEIIRQKPGPKNALGRVKFQFPNDDDIYMHDTPRRDLFAFDVRAFSHGCIRVHEPLDLAQKLLAREDAKTWTPRRVRVNAASNNQFRVDLEDGPVVHLDYITTVVDEDGEMIFLWDIYHHDDATLRARSDLKISLDFYYP